MQEFIKNIRVWSLWNNSINYIKSRNEKQVKLLKFLRDYGLLINDVTQTIENETKEEIGGFLGMPLGTLGSNVQGLMLTGKGVMKAGIGVYRAVQDF